MKEKSVVVRRRNPRGSLYTQRVCVIRLCHLLVVLSVPSEVAHQDVQLENVPQNIFEDAIGWV